MKMENKVAGNSPETKNIFFEQSTIIILFLGFILFKGVPLVQNNVEISALWEYCLSIIINHYPTLAGMMISFLTWHIMYFDSAFPGVDPPTPLSPSKYRGKSDANLHLNYIFALSMGPLATLLLYSGIV